MSGAKRYGVMVYMALLMDGFSEKMAEVLKNPAINVLGLHDGKGMINLDKLHKAACDAMHDELVLDIPVAGRFVFSRPDVDRLCEMIRRAAG